MIKKFNKNKKFKDSDGDGLSDRDEINIFGSDPYDADTDGDGIEDGEAVLMGIHPVTGKKLKDYFIPCLDNNYSPKVFKTRRLLFYTISILFIKLLLLIFVFFYPIVALMSPDIQMQEGRNIIALTNSLREKFNLHPLVESSDLNQVAYKKVEDMFINQYFAHTSPQGFSLEYFISNFSRKNYIVVGENLALGFDSASEVMTAWEDSPAHYSNLVDPNFKEIGVALAVDIYKDKNTFLTAQYFGLAKEISPPISSDNNNLIQENISNSIQKNTSSFSDISTTTREDGEVLSDFLEYNNDTELEQLDEYVEDQKLIKITSTLAQEVYNDINFDTAIKSESNTEAIETEFQPGLENYESILLISKPIGSKQDKVVKVEATLPNETTQANLEILNNNIEMTLVASSNDTPNNRWVGQAIIQNNDNSITPPIINFLTKTGEVKKAGITNNNIKQQTPSIINQYSLFRDSPNNAISQIFSISLIYIKILLVIAILLLLPNFFVPLNKVKPKIIISIFGFVVFLSLMIIF